MDMRCTAACLVVLALFASHCDAQWPYSKPSPRKQEPKKVPLDPQQSKQTFEKPLEWTFPPDPKPEPQPEVPYELRYPVTPATVAVECRETIAHVEVKRDMFGIGQPINPADLTLGTCAAVGEDTASQVLIFQSQLHDCGSSLMMTEDYLIYTFNLDYTPSALSDSPVVRTSKAAVVVECHYPRKHNVSSLPLDPLWIPFSAIKVAEEFLYFTLKLMTEDWQFERPIHQYFLGDMIYIEASVYQYFHVPLRVYVNRCVATLSDDMNSSPRYAFIEGNGCLIDAKITGSDSKFMSRSADHKLQFQLEAFRFKGADSGLLFITCHLSATSASSNIDADHRACSYINGWKEASGVDGACGSCDSVAPGSVGGSGGSVGSVGSVGSGGSGGSGWPGSGGANPPVPGRKIRDVDQHFEWEGDVTLGPIPIEEKVVA